MELYLKHFTPRRTAPSLPENVTIKSLGLVLKSFKEWNQYY